MRKKLSEVYETPQTELIDLELEQAVLNGSPKDDEDDPEITNPDMGWGF